MCLLPFYLFNKFCKIFLQTLWVYNLSPTYLSLKIPLKKKKNHFVLVENQRLKS